uniref:F-box domain-containing protein n=1 Tax=Plectus sambesii TaxID=2011161 RepID=A0A914W4S4_9BILA
MGFYVGGGTYTGKNPSVAALEAKVAHLRAEDDRLRRALGDVCGQIVCGQLTGKLPDNFLEQFSQLPDRPLEQVLRFLPARQVVQMRLVSRRFNYLIRKCSKTMPKKEFNVSALFESYNAGELTVDLKDSCGINITMTTIMLTDDEVTLSELLRFIRIDCHMTFNRGLSAADEVLDQLSKAWVTIRPTRVVFSGDLSQTSRDSLKAFLVKVEPSVIQLDFNVPENIGHNLLSADVISAAGRLYSLTISQKRCGSKPHNINIGDETLLAIIHADHLPSHLCFMDCSGTTPGGIRTFVEKWMKKERLKPDGKTYDFEMECELAFYGCANVTQAAVEEACADLLKDSAIACPDTSSVNDSEKMSDILMYFSSNRCLKIFFC